MWRVDSENTTFLLFGTALLLGFVSPSHAFEGKEPVRVGTAHDFEARNPYSRDLIRGYQDVLAGSTSPAATKERRGSRREGGSSGVRGGGSLNMLAMENYLEILNRQMRFWVEVGNIPQSALADVNVAGFWEGFRKSGAAWASANEKFIILDECVDSEGAPAPVVISTRSLRSCVSAAALEDRVATREILPLIALARSGVSFSQRDFLQLLNRSEAPSSAAASPRQRFFEYRARFTLGSEIREEVAHSEKIRRICQIANEDGSLYEAPLHAVKLDSIEKRQDDQGNLILSGTQWGRLAYAKCVE